MAKHRLVFKITKRLHDGALILADMSVASFYPSPVVCGAKEWKALKRIAADSNGRIVIVEGK